MTAIGMPVAAPTSTIDTICVEAAPTAICTKPAMPAALPAGVDATMILLADMPFVSPGIVRGLIEKWR